MGSGEDNGKDSCQRSLKTKSFLFMQESPSVQELLRRFGLPRTIQGGHKGPSVCCSRSHMYIDYMSQDRPILIHFMRKY